MVKEYKIFKVSFDDYKESMRFLKKIDLETDRSVTNFVKHSSDFFFEYSKQVKKFDDSDEIGGKYLVLNISTIVEKMLDIFPTAIKLSMVNTINEMVKNSDDVKELIADLKSDGDQK